MRRERKLVVFRASARKNEKKKNKKSKIREIKGEGRGKMLKEESIKGEKRN